MKHLFLTMILLMGSVMASYAVEITPVINAFNKGDASAIRQNMNEEVDLALPGVTKKCNPAEAVSQLNAFFGKAKPSGFSVLHHADKKESGFLVGKLPTSAGEYRVNITYKTDDNNKAIIQSIRIE